MAKLRPHTAYTADELVRKLPGWKAPTVPAPADGEPAELPPMGSTARDPILPEFKVSASY